MNTKLLQKCLEELGKEKVDISYIKGILETLIELNQNPVLSNPLQTKPVVQINAQEIPEEGSGLVSYVTTPGPIGRLE